MDNGSLFGLAIAELLFISVVTIVACIPLVLGEVEMSGDYGIRTRKAFKSNDNWIAMNRFGGKALIIASTLQLAVLLPLAIIFRHMPDVMTWICCLGPVGGLLPAFIAIKVYDSKLP